MWSKRPKPGGKGLRCTIDVQRDGKCVSCDRPAKRFRIALAPVAHWIAPLKPESMEINACVAHLQKLGETGAQIERVDMRKRKDRA
jgi:hypothetical protein